MSHRVVIQPNAEADLEEIHAYIHREFPLAADAWIDDCLRAILSLERFPRRCPVAPESAYFARTVRQLLSRSHRILYTVTRHDVHVLAVRSQRGLPFELPPLDA